MPHALDQSDVWVNHNGLSVQISTMSDRYALNAYRIMERNAVAIAIKYSMYLSSIKMPDVDTVAFDAVTANINSEIDRMQADVLGWLRDKPLMKALLGRVPIKPVEAVDVEVTFRPADPYTLPTFQQAPPAPEIPAAVRKSGDESIVFLVSTGTQEDYTVLAVFVGNRQAALRYAAEHDRYAAYGKADVEEWPDNAASGGGVREYLLPFTEVTYHTEIDIESGEVVSDWRPATALREGELPPITTEKEHIKRHSRQEGRGVIVTTGPEQQLAEVKRVHREAVISTVAAIQEIDQILDEGKK